MIETRRLKNVVFFIHIDMRWFCRRRISSPNTWQQTRFFNVDFDSNGLLFLFYIFQRSPFNLENKVFVRENFGSPHRSNWIYLLRNCFSNYLQRYVPSKHINVDIWLKMKAEPTYIYRRGFNVEKQRGNNVDRITSIQRR